MLAAGSGPAKVGKHVEEDQDSLQRVAVNKKQPASRRGEFDFLLN
jgi:hypothetical protein